ncbi:MAG: metallophosphoesterase [Beijerinckiaceae bacterium]|nr:metallophosphoesterase [Beijerinckiaceae bacterium]
MRVIQISDTHISAEHAFFDRNTRAIKAWLLGQTCDLVIHTGDVSMDGAGAAADFEASGRWLADMPCETLCVPGNHDVGDLASIKAAQPVDDQRIAAWRSAIGPDYWVRDRAGWRLIGLDAMLLATGHPDEERQFDWLEQQLRTSLPVAIFLHKPLFVDHPDEGPRGYWTVLPEPRRRILDLMGRADVKLVASGHLHIHRQLRHGAIDYVWGPAASFVVGDSQEPLGGERKLGVVEHVFSVDGVTSRFIRPDGLEDLTIDPVLHILYPSPARDEQVA